MKNRYHSGHESGKDSQIGSHTGSTDQVNLLTRKKGLSGHHSNSPMYLSSISTGVQPDAQKGLEKYHKVYLQKI